MATSEAPKSSAEQPLDLLALLKDAAILPDLQFKAIRAKVLTGQLPFDARDLARRLVRDGDLTEYQATRLLRGKSHGMAIGKYVILDRLGAGSMGRVFKANHLLMNRLVALKLIAPEVLANKRIVARFQREMKLVGRLDHPNVVRAFDADQIGQVLYIVMEYVPGRSLGQMYREQGTLPASEIVRWAADACEGLGHAHGQGIVHRDVKPSNILLGDDGRARVLDLGLGVLMEADPQASFATADGFAVGTVDYMSPEQALGREVDGRSDLYNLGCTMYHLISGRHVFSGDSQIERLGKRINGRPTPLMDLVPELPAGLPSVLDGLLANRPEDRYETAEEAADALHEVAFPGRSRARRGGAEVAEARPVEERIVEVEVEVEVEIEPDYPGWFRPVAELAERNPAGAAALFLGLGLAFFGMGFFLALIVSR